MIAGERKAQSASLKPMRPFRTYPFQLGIFLNRPPHRPCPVDGTVADGDAVGPLQVLHAPGHSPGHLAFHLAEHGLADRGRRDRATWPRLEAGWRAFTLNPVEQHESLARFASLEPRIVAVGHGDEVTEDAAAKVHAFAERPMIDVRDLELRNATYARFVELGRAPRAGRASARPPRWSRGGGASTSARALVLDGDGAIRMANPFSAVPTPYRGRGRRSRRGTRTAPGTRSGSAPPSHVDGRDRDDVRRLRRAAS